MILPPPIPPHPAAPMWCHRCGQLECVDHPFNLAAKVPPAPRSLPPGREWAPARRRTRALAALARIGGAT